MTISLMRQYLIHILVEPLRYAQVFEFLDSVVCVSQKSETLTSRSMHLRVEATHRYFPYIKRSGESEAG